MAPSVVSGPFGTRDQTLLKSMNTARLKYDPKQYSDNFLTFVHDFNNDDWDDILIIGWPGYKKDHEHVWYSAPRKAAPG